MKWYFIAMAAAWAFAGGQALASDMSDQILAVHNQERAEVGVAPLTWNDQLAADAAIWAEHLAELNVLQHSTTDDGENLWAGTRDAYSYADMAQTFADEKAYYSYGTFPNVSTNGDWKSVGHYTQMIWGNTTEVGCAKASNAEMDFLVCRYSPPGNYVNEKPY